MPEYLGLTSLKFTFAPQTEAAFMQDAVKVFAKAFGTDVDFINGFQMVPTSCMDYKLNTGYEPSSSGRDILEKVDAVNKFLIS